MPTQHTPKRGRHFYGPGPYIERDADDALFDALRGGEYAMVLGPRGSGKTALRIRTGARLLEAGVRVASVDLGAIGAESRADAFCASLLIEAGRSLGLEVEAKRAWRRSKGPPQLRLRACLREVILETPSPDDHTDRGSDSDSNPIPTPADAPVVLFIDGLELTRALDSARDDFFSALRAMADARGSDPIWARLSVCLVGALTRDELVSDPRRDAFELPAREVTPRDFSREQLDALTPTLAPLGVDTAAMIDALHEWTSGSPAMVQWTAGDLLLREVEAGAEATMVEAVIRETFLQRGPEVAPLLGDTARRLRRDQRAPWRTRCLAAYERVLRGERVDLRGRQLGADGALIVARLKIAGLVAPAAGGKLRVRNKVVERAFDLNWVRRALAGRPVSDALERWEAGLRRPGLLLRGQTLDEASSWLEGRPDVTPRERDFVLASEHGRTQRLRRLLLAGGALSLGLAGLLGLALWQYRGVLEGTDTDAGSPQAQNHSQAGPDADTGAADRDRADLQLAGLPSTFVTQTRQAVEEASGTDLHSRTVTDLDTELDVLEQRLAVERAQRAELLASDPLRRGEGLALALMALEPWALTVDEAPAPVTRALTLNLASPGDTRVITAHHSAVRFLALTQDRILSVVQTPSQTTELRVWSLASGRRLASFESPAGAPRHVAISPNGEHIACISRGGALTVWALSAGHTHGPAPIVAPTRPGPGAIAQDPGAVAQVIHLQVDDAGGVLVRRGDGSIDAVDPQAGHASIRVRASALPSDLPLDFATMIPPAPARPPRLALLNDGSLELWDPLSGAALASVLAPDLPTGIAGLTLLPDGRHLLVRGTHDPALFIWDFSSGTLEPIASQDSPISAVATTEDGGLFATGAESGAVRVWSREGRLIAELGAHASPITSLSFVRGGLVSADADGELRIQALRKHDRPDASFARWDSEGRGLTLGVGPDQTTSDDADPGPSRLWRDGLDRLGPLPPLALAAPVARVSADLEGQRIALLFQDGRAGLYDADHHVSAAMGPDPTGGATGEASGALVRVGGSPGPMAADGTPGFASPHGRALDIALSADGSVFAVAFEGRSIGLWGGAGEPIAILSGHEAPVEHLALSLDGARLVSADRAGGLRVWDPHTAALLATLDSTWGSTPDTQSNPDNPDGSDASPGSSVLEPAVHLAVDASFVLGIDALGGASLWSLDDHTRTASFEVGREPIHALRASTDGTYVALARPGVVELWRTDSGEVVGRFRLSAPVLALRFDGDALLAIDAHGTSTRWPVDPRLWLSAGCRALPPGAVLPAVCPVDGG